MNLKPETKNQNLPGDAKLDASGSALSSRFTAAFAFSCQMHAGQSRKGSGVPYISHVMAVAGLVLEAGGDEDTAIAALLHDVVEDCGGAPVLAEVRARFGDRVAEIVDGCTDSDETPKPPWQGRKDLYLQHLKTATPAIRLVSAADKVHNVRSIIASYREVGEQVWLRFKGGRDGSLWYYRALADELVRDHNMLTQELQRVVTELEQLVGA